MRKRTKYIYTATTLENLSKGHHHDNITYRRLDHIPLEELFSRNMKKGRTQCRSFRSVQDLGKGVSGKAYPRLCNARRPQLETWKLNHIEKKIHLHSHWQFSTIGRRGEKNHYWRIYNHEIEWPSYLGWFQGEGGLYGKPWGADPRPKSRLWSCSISCDLRSLKKSSLVVSSTKVEDVTIGCLPNSMP